MTAKQFAAALELLGWKHDEAAVNLGVAARSRISEWASGYRKVPPYIAASLEKDVQLARLKATAQLPKPRRTKA